MLYVVVVVVVVVLCCMLLCMYMNMYMCTYMWVGRSLYAPPTPVSPQGEWATQLSYMLLGGAAIRCTLEH